MDWTQTIFQVIDTRSFSSIWYWIIVAIIWSTATTWVMGVPSDMIHRARREGGQAAVDVTDMVRIFVNRQRAIAAMAGLWLAGLGCFILTALLVLGFFYGVEMAQAIFLIALPLTFVGAMTTSYVGLIAATDPQGEDLFALLLRQRLWTQVIGMVAIFVTGMFGMYHNLAVMRLL